MDTSLVLVEQTGFITNVEVDTFTVCKTKNKILLSI